MFGYIRGNMFLFFIIFLIVVAPSFFVGAMQVFLFIILGFILLAMVGGWMLRRKIKKMQEQAGQAYGGFGTNANSQQSRQQSRRRPDVEVYSSTSATDKSVSENVGEYVEFEEIKEKK